jgi:hypothetical protein
MGGIMKRIIIIVSFLVLMTLTGCTSNKEALNSETQTDSQMGKQTTDSSNINSSDSYMWNNKPKLTNIDTNSSNSDKRIQEVIEKQKNIKSADDVFTDKVKGEMTVIINQWGGKEFYSVKHIDQQELLQLNISKYTTSVVTYEGKPMIKISFKTPEINYNDSICALIDCENNEYSVTVMWYEETYKQSIAK